MWSLIQKGEVVTIYKKPQSLVLKQTRYPSSIFTLYSEEERNNIGIYSVIKKEEPDFRFYIKGQSEYIFDEENKIVNEYFTIIERNLKELKKQQKYNTKKNAYDYITEYSWLVERFIFDNTQKIPNEVSNYTKEIRLRCKIICLAIDKCVIMEEFKELFKNTIYKWPNDMNIREYKR